MVQMPALNTPQFSWVKSRLPHTPQPVPPIFQPEGAAEAIYWAAHHDRPEVYVGWPTVKAIVGNKIAPRLIDHYLALTGYRSQQTNIPEDPTRPDNLCSLCPATTALTVISMHAHAPGASIFGSLRIAGCLRSPLCRRLWQS
jgi:hypothetical protein